jgi:hypothetical protein
MREPDRVAQHFTRAIFSRGKPVSKQHKKIFTAGIDLLSMPEANRIQYIFLTDPGVTGIRSVKTRARTQ